MKTLANCKPSEFLKQANRIKKSVEKWIEATQLMEFRKRKPQLIEIRSSMTEEERLEAKETNKKRMNDALKQNALEFLDMIMDKHPDETLELLALCCFVEPEDVDDHSVSEYLESFSELITDAGVLNFFTSLAYLEGKSS